MPERLTNKPNQHQSKGPVNKVTCLLPVAVQYRIESGVQTFSSSIPNLVVLAVIGAVALASFWIARRRKLHSRARVQASANIATNPASGPDSAAGDA